MALNCYRLYSPYTVAIAFIIKMLKGFKIVFYWRPNWIYWKSRRPPPPSALPTVHYLQIDLRTLLCVGSRLFISSRSPHWLLQHSAVRDDWPQRGNQMRWGLNSKMTISTPHRRPAALLWSPEELQSVSIIPMTVILLLFFRRRNAACLEWSDRKVLLFTLPPKSKITPTYC